MDLLIAGGAFLVWAAVVWFARRYRIWLIYYAIGAVGFALFLLYLLNRFPGQVFFEMITARSVHNISDAINIPTRIFDAAPATVLVLVITQEIGWTALEVGIESSGLLEAVIFVSLLLFYPGWDWARKAKYIAAGLVATYYANVGRVLVIVYVLHYLGKDWLLFAHTLLGKAVFFVFAIAIYWYLITLPTIVALGKRLRLREQL